MAKRKRRIDIKKRIKEGYGTGRGEKYMSPAVHQKQTRSNEKKSVQI